MVTEHMIASFPIWARIQNGNTVFLYLKAALCTTLILCSSLEMLVIRIHLHTCALTMFQSDNVCGHLSLPISLQYMYTSQSILFLQRHAYPFCITNSLHHKQYCCPR